MYCTTRANGLDGRLKYFLQYEATRIIMIKAGIIGGTGYTGVELLRLLAQHPEVELKVITSRGKRFHHGRCRLVAALTTVLSFFHE